MSITFIESPLFVVDFTTYLPKTEKEILSLNQKIQKISSASFKYVKFFFMAVNQGAYRTFTNAGTSFKYIVLGYYGSLANFRPPEDIYLAAFKIVFWILAMGWCWVTTTNRIFLEKISSDTSLYLSHFTGEDINIKHIRTQELLLDASDVPADITMDSLSKFFDEINFNDPEKSGYMAPISRQEGSTTYTIDELKESLNTFISNVKIRKAFLGTPPAYDIPRLMEFYQQIEDATRLSIYKAQTRLQKFKKINGDKPEIYNADQLREYKNLLEDQSRIALNLAIAGKHCGARYMGEAMENYYSLYEESLSIDKSLEDTLVEILAHKRKEIAQAEIQQHLGNDTHSFNKYMVNLGELLGIPGTKNIVEHLDTRFDRDKFLTSFFQKYTVNLIIDTLQEKIKKSNLLREKITNWLQDQVGDWKKEECEMVSPEDIFKIEQILKEKNNSRPSLYKHLEDVLSLVSHLKEKGVNLAELGKPNKYRKEVEEDDFIEDLFGLVEARDWCHKIKFKDVDINVLKQQKQFKNRKDEDLVKIAHGQKIRELKTTCSAEILGLPLLKHLKRFITGDDVVLQHEQFIQKFSAIEKAEKIFRIIPLEKDTIIRVIEGKNQLENVIRDYQDRKRRPEFLYALNLGNIANIGVSKEILEWLLVSQHILLPQNIG